MVEARVHPGRAKSSPGDGRRTPSNSGGGAKITAVITGRGPHSTTIRCNGTVNSSTTRLRVYEKLSRFRRG